MPHPVIATAQRMAAHLDQAGGSELVSKFWTALSRENTRMLEATGPEAFKRSLSQNYFNWAVDDPAHPQMRTLLKAWAEEPSRGPLQAELHGSAELEGVALSRYVTSAEAARTYTLFVGLLWWYATRNWPDDLPARLSEPELGDPVDIRLDGRRISQDLANSLREWRRIAAALGHSGPRPVVAEIGAGYGRVGYVALQALPCRYWVFDISPALAVSEWYLSSVFPEKRAFRWRPFASWAEVAPEVEAADMAFFTIDQLSLLPERSVEVFAAISVLHEMVPEKALQVLELMGSKTRQAIYLKNWTVWDNIWDGLAFRSEDLRPPAGMTQLWSRLDDVLAQFTEKLFARV